MHLRALSAAQAQPRQGAHCALFTIDKEPEAGSNRRACGARPGAPTAPRLQMEDLRIDRFVRRRSRGRRATSQRTDRLRERRLTVRFKRSCRTAQVIKQPPSRQLRSLAASATRQESASTRERGCATASMCELRSGRPDSNGRPLEPHSSALPGCATPRALHSIPARCRRQTGCSRTGRGASVR